MSTGNLDGRVAVVTGATGGMGLVIAIELARQGAHVVTVARNTRRADALREHLTQVIGTGGLDVIAGDLSRRADVKSAAKTIADRYPDVHILVNNAGAHFPSHQLTPDGVEMHVAVDYLAAFGLTALLSNSLRRGRARVVNVASDTVNDARKVKLPGRPRPATLDLSRVNDVRDLNPPDTFASFEAYARAKLMTVTAGYNFARELAPDGVTVNSLHPGMVGTDIINDLIPPLLRPLTGLIRRSILTAEKGAAAALRLCTDPALAAVSGRYFNRARAATTPAISHDPVTQMKLRALSDAHFGSAPPTTVPDSDRLHSPNQP